MRGPRIYLAGACIQGLIRRHQHGLGNRVWQLLRPAVVNNWRDLKNLMFQRLSP